MTYRVIVERRAVSEIESLPNNVLQRVVDAIGGLNGDPRPHGVKKLVGGTGWRIRIGEYRVLFAIDDPGKVVTVYRVKHRKDVYR